MRPIYKYLIIFLILGTIAWIIYFVVSKTTPTEEQGNTTISTSTTNTLIEELDNNEQTPTDVVEIENNETGDGGNYSESAVIKTSFTELQKVSDVPAQSYWYYEENNRIFYITENGEIKKVIDGKSEKIALNPLNNVSMIKPNRGGSSVLIKFATNSGTIWGIFSSMDEKITPLNSSITDAVWDFNNQDIVALWDQGGTTSVVSLSSLKSYSDKTVIIPKLKLFDVDIFKKSRDELLFVEKFGNEYATSIWQYNLKTKLFSTIRSGLLDFSLNPELSVYFFYSKNDGFVIGNNSFENIVPTTKKTLPEKCSSLVTTAFCFVPKTDISLFNWITNLSFTDDLLYVYDTYSQTEDQVQISDIKNIPIDAKNIIVTQPSLYFINKYDNFIYALK
ncbi:hypothetical protein C4565_00970 [Candidatus Parcubacteria bacterium]|jgi:hypothetical protein|nr:MAG: hypothetical protein C4565_00970 [Candidatus Parcubacteria bacterium]